MSLLWEGSTQDTHYSVRRSGASVRLYSNRVFHSQWNPNSPFNGGIWDCLSLPALYRPADTLRRILLLGVGGGAVVRQLAYLSHYDTFFAIEIDVQHIDIATRWFGVDAEQVDLVNADAIEWLADYNGPPFDLIIDDLFGHSDGEPMRACEFTPHWVSLLRQHLSDEGLLIINCIDNAELGNALPVFADFGFRYGYKWTLPLYENAVAALSARSLQAREWSRNLETSELDSASQRQARCTIRRPIRNLNLQDR